MQFEDIYGLVQDAGIERGIDGAWIGLEEEIVAFAELVAAKEREACAKIAEIQHMTQEDIARVIRDRT